MAKTQKQRKPVVLLAFEGKNNETERNYFSNFNNRDFNFVLKTYKSSNTDPYGMAESTLKHANKEGIGDADLGDKIFCLIDLDLSKKQLKKYHEAIKAFGDKLEFIISNPCFEIWYLFHFETNTEKQTSSDAVKKQMCKYVKDYKESTEVYKKYGLKDKTQDAIKNAKSKESNLKDIPLEDKNPYTEVYKLIELFKQMA